MLEYWIKIPNKKKESMIKSDDSQRNEAVHKIVVLSFSKSSKYRLASAGMKRRGRCAENTAAWLAL
ncbi:hypothetical protein [Acinetobacter pragensis]|uniref:hypothetical protein n=1 Tax=Acinetobacter pragensis TaxID=1806892 RepID=UPI0033428FEF